MIFNFSDWCSPRRSSQPYPKSRGFDAGTDSCQECQGRDGKWIHQAKWRALYATRGLEGGHRHAEGFSFICQEGTAFISQSFQTGVLNYFN